MKPLRCLRTLSKCYMTLVVSPSENIGFFWPVTKFVWYRIEYGAFYRNAHFWLSVFKILAVSRLTAEGQNHQIELGVTEKQIWKQIDQHIAWTKQRTLHIRGGRTTGLLVSTLYMGFYIKIWCLAAGWQPADSRRSNHQIELGVTEKHKWKQIDQHIVWTN